MSDRDRSIPPGNTEAKLLLWIFLASAALMFVVFLLDLAPWAVVPTAYVLPIILAASLFLAIRLARKGASPIPAVLGAVGILYIVGGGAFDMIATVMHTPNLHDEGNLVARALLDSGHALPLVYAYAILSQTLWLALVTTAWLGLLRHREILTASLQGHSSFMPFLKAATGGRRLSWRQWIFPMRISDAPRAYELFWTLAAMLIAGMIDRWYLGLEWFNLAPATRWIVVVAALFLGLAGYFSWLWFASRPMRNAP